ncbi:MAG: hypothetical protein VB857_00810, partial [Pirellulaceae bacterium]
RRSSDLSTSSRGQRRPRQDEQRRVLWAVMLGIVPLALFFLCIGIYWSYDDTRVSTPAGLPDRPAPDDHHPPLTLVQPEKDVDEDLSTEVVVYQQGTGEIGLAAIVATLHGKTIRCEVNGTEGQIASWTDPQDWVSWKFNVLKPGYFKAEVTYAAAQDAHQGTYRIQIDEQPSKACGVESPMGTTGRTDEYFFFINRSGTHVLSVKAGKKPGKELMVLKSIRLCPK